jgi:glycosyltransferase involved in cell wall biosynthesis
MAFVIRRRRALILDGATMKVSVIIPALNAQAFIDGAISSVLAQTLSDLEVVVVDDGSTDHTAAIVQGFMANDARIRLLQHPRPQGVSAARNAAIRAARGDWIALLDADDQFAPGRLERLVAEAEARGLDGLADNLELVDFVTKTPLGPAFPADWMTTGGLLTLDILIDKDTPGNHDFRPLGLIKPILRRGRLQHVKIEYAEDIGYSEDFLFYALLVMSGFRMGLTPAALYVYAVRPGSESNRSALNQDKDTQNILEVNRRIAHIHDLYASRSNPKMDIEARSIQCKLRRRDQAIKYWRFVTLAKDHQFVAALNAARHIKSAYMIKNLWTALRRRYPGVRLSTRRAPPSQFED